MEKIEISQRVIEQAKLGNEQAIDQIYNKLKHTINSIARRYFIEASDFEDVVQEGMIGLHKAIMGFNDIKGSFVPFARLCINRQIQTAVKKARAKKNLNLKNFVSFERSSVLEIICEPDLELERRANTEEYNKRFKNIKKLLSKNEFNVLELYLEGLSYKEIAGKLELTVRACENSILRAKKKLTNNGGEEVGGK